MKKLFVILLMMMYGFSSSGMTLQFHYCCGKLKNVDLSAVKRKSCGGEQKMDGKSCCETKQLSAGSNDDHFKQQVLFSGFETYGEAIIPVATIGACTFSTPGPVAIFPSPPLQTRPVYLRNCVFRI